MKSLKIYIPILLLALFFGSCGEHSHDGDSHEGHDHGEASHEESTYEENETAETDVVHLVQEQMDVMEIEIGKFQDINLRTTVKANGHLELPPQNKASVSALMGGRVKSINVTVGTYVKKGQILARLEHPEYLELQENYLETKANLAFLKADYDRKKQLLADSITSVKNFQETESKYKMARANYTAISGKLKMLGVSLQNLEKGNMVSTFPVISPINGYVRLVEINMGMSIQPEQELFEIVDNEHIHIDLRVYEKDIDRVKEGQKVTFTLTSQPEKVFEGKVFAMGKAFENDPKAVVVHAEIENKSGNLLPGMYVDARIEADKQEVRALPEEAIVQDGGLSYIFIRDEAGHDHEEGEDHGDEYLFRKIEVNTGARDIGFVEVVPAQSIPSNPEIVTKGTFYLLAELKKGEGGHEHHH